MQERNPAKDLLFTHFNSSFLLNEEEKEKLTLLFSERKIKRRGFILQDGDICRHFTFIVSGCFKMYAIDF
ncbi:hypothetical protein [Pedobacter sp. NJ-S-72]